MRSEWHPKSPPFCLLVVALATGCESEEKETFPSGHDPARIVRTDGVLLQYFSGLEFSYFDDESARWKAGLEEQCDGDYCILRGKDAPDWLEEHLGGGDVEVGAAPGMLDARTLYYTVADWEGDDGTACIGLARATGSAPSLQWTDVGEPVLCSTPTSVAAGDTFAIDAAPFVDAEGTTWMVWGSHYSGIWGVELEESTGLLVEGAQGGWSEEGPYHHLAVGPQSNESAEAGHEGGTIEAAYVHERDGAYFLFVNWYACCNEIDSTYEIHVGRSDHPMGPYLDRNGERLDEGGGTLLLGSEGRFIGPGHAGIYRHTDGREVFTFHFYDAQGEDPTGSLARRLLSWDNDGWPQVSDEAFVP